MVERYLVDLVFWCLLGIDISLFCLCYSNILYVMAFFDCILLSNFKRLRCVCYYIYRHWIKVYTYNKRRKEYIVYINSSLWESGDLLILVPYLVCKAFFVSCGSCDPRGAPAPFRFMVCDVFGLFRPLTLLLLPIVNFP